MPKHGLEKNRAPMGKPERLDCVQVPLCYHTNDCLFLCFHSACEGLSGEVGNNSCIGRGACQELVDVIISDNACTCKDCCRCILEGDTIPDGSCTALAKEKEDIEYVPYQTFDPVEFCCPEGEGGGSSSGGSGGGVGRGGSGSGSGNRHE